MRKTANTIERKLPVLLTVGEASAVARVSKQTIMREYQKGELRFFKTPAGGLVRIYRSSLIDWIEAHSQGGAK